MHLLALLLCCYLSLICSSASASSHLLLDERHTDTVQTHTFSIYYRVNSVDIDEDYLDNSANLEYIRYNLARSPKIDSITIRCYASLEGEPKHNAYLAQKRGEAARKYIVDHLPKGSALKVEDIHIAPTAENWEGLRRLVDKNYQRKDRQKVLNILDSDASTELKKLQLKKLSGGSSYRYLVQNYMSTLRLATWICVWVDKNPREFAELGGVEPISALAFTPDPAYLLPTKYPEPVQQEETPRKTVLALRTNLLMPIQTVGIEFPIGDHWSIGADYYFPWFLSKNNKYCLECLEWWLDAKYWVTGEKYAWSDASKLKGHAFGVHLMGGYYDFQSKKKYCRQGEYGGVGLDYTFALPVAHDKLRIAFTIGVGYIYTSCRPYHPTGDWKYLIRDQVVRHENSHYFGPTRACISLVWPLTFKTKGRN